MVAGDPEAVASDLRYSWGTAAWIKRGAYFWSEMMERIVKEKTVTFADLMRHITELTFKNVVDVDYLHQVAQKVKKQCNAGAVVRSITDVYRDQRYIDCTVSIMKKDRRW